jgi:Zn finger protein HypA/HybF involved in hydrogenase expression
MNERIQQLALQAGFYANPDIEKFEKFAELIVRECIAACAKHDIESFGILSVRAAMVTKSCQNNIKEHFGVEESKGWVCPKCNADRTKIACPLGFGATVDGRCPMTVEAQ